MYFCTNAFHCIFWHAGLSPRSTGVGWICDWSCWFDWIGLDWLLVIGYWWILDWLVHVHFIISCMFMFVKENWVFVYCIHVHVFMKTGFSCEWFVGCVCITNPKPRWGIISVELLWLLGSGINWVTSPGLSLGDNGIGREIRADSVVLLLAGTRGCLAMYALGAELGIARCVVGARPCTRWARNWASLRSQDVRMVPRGGHGA